MFFFTLLYHLRIEAVQLLMSLLGLLDILRNLYKMVAVQVRKMAYMPLKALGDFLGDRLKLSRRWCFMRGIYEMVHPVEFDNLCARQPTG